MKQDDCYTCGKPGKYYFFETENGDVCLPICGKCFAKIRVDPAIVRRIMDENGKIIPQKGGKICSVMNIKTERINR